jgi:hypothetical protein
MAATGLDKLSAGRPGGHGVPRRPRIPRYRAAVRPSARGSIPPASSCSWTPTSTARSVTRASARRRRFPTPSSAPWPWSWRVLRPRPAQGPAFQQRSRLGRSCRVASCRNGETRGYPRPSTLNRDPRCQDFRLSLGHAAPRTSSGPYPSRSTASACSSRSTPTASSWMNMKFSTRPLRWSRSRSKSLSGTSRRPRRNDPR